ncbi:MAG: hypothetical protein DRJ07_08420 [Bacteroidetes bacterium]|nr:MAG: hypothetical protein DRJ07_08420 [Bacteroidota bacterium]
MQKPYLIIVAGCNGSGKSTFSKTHVNAVEPFDFDKRFMEIYDSMSDSELRHQIAKNTAIKEFESSINGAFSKGENFCYETNFDDSPLYWAEKAKKLGYRIELIFYCLSSLDLAKKRVRFRTKNKGHYVADNTIDYKWKEGYKNLNLHFQFFDFILLVDNSSKTQPAQDLFALIKNDDNHNGYEAEFYSRRIPPYAKIRIPNIYKTLLNL